MSWERLGWLLFTACGLALLSLHSAVFLEGKGFSSTSRDVLLAYCGWAIRYTIILGPMLVAVTIADNIPVKGAARVAVLAIALITGALFQWPIRCYYEPWEPSACHRFPSLPARFWLGGQTLSVISWSTVIALAYFYRRRDLRVAEALHAAQLARADMQRRKLESELETMRARVEPAFLFETLGDVGKLFERDVARGERILDELIQYLRAALPDMRGARSTVSQEIALARAYLNICELRIRPVLATDVEAAAALENVAMPPMLILPLVGATVDAIIARDEDATSISLEASTGPERIRIVLIARGPAIRSIEGAPAVHEMRDRLRAIYGNRASLAVDVEFGKRLTAVLEIPHEIA